MQVTSSPSPDHAEELVRQPMQPILALANAGHLDEALQQCLVVIQSAPTIDHALRLALQILLRQKRHADAKSLLQQLVQGHATAWRLGALLDLMRMTGEKRDVALGMAEQALNLFPDEHTVRLSCGAVFQSCGKEDKAIALYEACLQNKPDDIGVKNNLAELYRKRGQYDEAIALWESLQDVDSPHRLTFRLNLAQAYGSRGDKQAAEKHFRSILAEEARNAEALRGLAKILSQAGDYATALPLAQAALQADPSMGACWQLTASLLENLGRMDEAVNTLILGCRQARMPLPLHQSLFAYWLSQDMRQQAQESAQRWMQAHPAEAAYALMLGRLAQKYSDYDAAERYFQLAEQKDWKQGGMALVRLYEDRQRLDLAMAQAQKMVQRDPGVTLHHGLLAEVCYSAGQYDYALAAVQAGLSHDPYNDELTQQKIRMLCAQERYDAAIATAQALVAHKPLPRHHKLLLHTWKQAGNFAAAEAHSRALHERDPNMVHALWYIHALRASKKSSEAAALCHSLYEIETSNAEVGTLYINLLLEMEDYEQAFAVAQQRMPEAGERPDSVRELAIILRDMGKTEQAIELLQKGIVSFPHNMALRQLLADMWRRLDKVEEERQVVLATLAAFPPRQCLDWCVPRLLYVVEASTHKGPALEHPDIQVVLDKIRQWGKESPHSLGPYWLQYRIADKLSQTHNVLAALDAIEERHPDHVRAMHCRAEVYSKLHRVTEAVALRRKLCQLQPNAVSPLGGLLSELTKAGDYEEFDAIMQRMQHFWGDFKYAHYQSLFFSLNCHPTWSAETIYSFYQQWYEKSLRPTLPPAKPHKNNTNPERKLRIAYMSPDFRQHAVAYFSEPLLMRHDREHFEIYALAHLEHGQADAFTDRFKSYVDHWVPTQGMSSAELIKYIREERIDIVVDLAGYTANSRLHILAQRPAPIGISHIIGAGQTSGIPEVDYHLLDANALPEEFDHCIAEKPLRLPKPGLAFKPPADIPEALPLPCHSNGFVTLGIMCRPVRTSRQAVQVWAQILHAAPTVKLAFDHRPYVEEEIVQRFVRHFADCGIGQERLIFRNSRPHWDAYQQLDILLDPFPAGSGTVATEALWMRRPVMTLASRPIMGRLPMSQLLALDLQDHCVATSTEEYIAKVVALATDVPQLTALWESLPQRIAASSLVDYAGLGRDMAALYRKIWRDYCAQKENHS